jgi:dihydrodipicolinate synthase/N-acetylneuraminate lyase
MNNETLFRGVWCPSVTPFNDMGGIDFSALERHILRLTDAGINVILLMGSIGEFASLSLDERKQLIRKARAMSPLPMVVNVSSTCVDDMLQLAELAYECGYDAVMVLPHYYFSQTPHQLFSYYQALNDRLAGKWFAYNFPARTGCDLDAPLVAKMVAAMPNFAGIKDTVDCLSHNRAIIQATAAIRNDFAVLSGYDEYLVPNLLAGGAGVISGLNNIVPELFAQAIHAWETGELPELIRIQREIGRLSAIYAIGDDFVTTIKTAVSRRFGYMGAGSRSYGGELDEIHCAAIDDLFSV